MKICIAGKNDIAVNSLNFLIQNSIIQKDNIFVITNQTDKGIDGFQRSLERYAIQNKIKIVGLKEIESLDDLIFLSLEFDKIIDTSKFKSKELFNIHFSKLPEYKGMYTSALPILHGKKETGVTLHIIDKGIDTGDIIDQIVFPIDDEDCCRDLYLKYSLHGFNLFKSNIYSIINGNYTQCNQSSQNSTYFSKYSINYNNLEIDLLKTAYEIKNQIRAYNYEECQIPKLFGFEIFKAKILDIRSTKYPREIIQDRTDYLEIATIDYNIRLYKNIRSKGNK